MPDRPPYQVFELGPLSDWKQYVGGSIPTQGRKFIEKDLALDFFGVSINSREAGEQAGYWHSHSTLEELYLFLDGEGELALDKEVLAVKAGSAVRVGPGVMRTWRCSPNSPVPLKWICIRAAGAKLADIPRDAWPITDQPMPWKTEK